ncbi:MAG: AAA family ATPase [Chloroflexota bacterium]
MKPLGFTEKDLYAIQRAFSGLSIEGLEYSVAAESIIGLADDPFVRIAVRQKFSAIPRLWDNLAAINPNQPLNDQQKSEIEERLIWLHEITRIEKPKYLIDDYPFYEKGFNMLIGKAGSRKSLIAVDFIGKAAQQYPDQTFLFIAGEGFAGLKARMKAWEKHQRITLKNLLLLGGGVQFKDDVQRYNFKEACQQHNVAFVVVDTLQTVTVGLDENSTKEMGVFCDIIRDMTATLDIGILFIHHLNKNDQYRGSSVLMASADSAVRTTVDDNGLVTLYNSLAKGGKNKDNEEAEPIHKRVLSLEMQIGDELDSVGVIEAADKVIDEPNKVTGNPAKILEYLSVYPDGVSMTEIVEATQISSSSAYHAVGRLKQQNYVVRKNSIVKITKQGQQML